MPAPTVIIVRGLNQGVQSLAAMLAAPPTTDYDRTQIEVKDDQGRTFTRATLVEETLPNGLVQRMIVLGDL